MAEILPEQGKKLCLFIGRAANEPLPEVENEVWISLDSELFNIPGMVMDLSARCHLQIDMNQDTQHLSQISGLFNKVVLDYHRLNRGSFGFAENQILRLFGYRQKE